MRIIAGEFKGSRLETPSSDAAHVMGERERAAIFNALFSLGGVEGARVLDMFAGSGALGFEAISRGATEADFVENNVKTREIIKRNLQTLMQTGPSGTASNHPVVTGDSRLALGRSLRESLQTSLHQSLPVGEQYDVIFSDAPYDEPQWETVAKLPGLLVAGGCLAVSHAKNEPIPGFATEKVAACGLRNVYSKTFANAQIDIFVK